MIKKFLCINVIRKRVRSRSSALGDRVVWGGFDRAEVNPLTDESMFEGFKPETYYLLPETSLFLYLANVYKGLEKALLVVFSDQKVKMFQDNNILALLDKI